MLKGGVRVGRREDGVSVGVFANNYEYCLHHYYYILINSTFEQFIKIMLGRGWSSIGQPPTLRVYQLWLCWEGGHFLPIVSIFSIIYWSVSSQHTTYFLIYLSNEFIAWACWLHGWRYGSDGSGGREMNFRAKKQIFVLIIGDRWTYDGAKEGRRER